MENETLKIHNHIIEYGQTGRELIQRSDLENNVTVYYDNDYMTPKQKKTWNERIHKLESESQQIQIVLSLIYILRNECVNVYNHLTEDEQLYRWMRIRYKLPTPPKSPIANKCSTLMKHKLEQLTQREFYMNPSDDTSIYLIPLQSYTRGSYTSKMHICFNPILLGNPKLYFEAIMLFHIFYTQYMINICIYKVIGSNVDRDSKEKNVVAWNNFNRKMADIAIYLEHISDERSIIEYGERFRTFFMNSWKHKIVPFSNSKLLFNNPINDKLKEGKYFIQFTSGSSGDTKLDCISKIQSLPQIPEYDGELLSPQSICRTRFKIKPGISFKKEGLKYRVDCKKSRDTTRKECKKGIRNKYIGRFVDSRFVKDVFGENKHVCYDELCFY